MKYSSAILTGASGSLGGATASRNKGGGYFRARVKGTNPSTTAQVAQRSMFSTIAAAWRGLTAAQRTAWEDATPYFPYTDALGSPKTYSGFQLFASLNGGLRSANPSATLLFSPPSPVAFPTLTLSGGALELSGGDLTLSGTFTASTVPTDFRCKVYATQGVSAGIGSPAASSFSHIATINAAGNIGTTLATLSSFGVTAAIGQKVFLKFVFISTVSGQTKEMLLFQTIVA